MKLLSITFPGKKNKYTELYEAIIDLIKEQKLKPYDKLPSKRELSVHLGVSLNTIIKAYDMLYMEGYIESKERKGYYVNPIEMLPKFSQSSPSIEKSHSTYLYNLSTERIDSLLFPKIQWRRIMRNVLSNDECYSIGPGNGSYLLRDAIAKHIFMERGVITKPENIVIGSGIEGLLPILLSLQEGNLAIENPGYPKIKQILLNSNRQFSFIDAFSYSIPENTKILYLTPSHQFPTGRVMPIQKRMDLIQWAHNQLGYILEDDYDSSYRFMGSIIPSLQSLDPDHVIYYDTFSRTISPSLRIAYMVLPNSLLAIYQEKYHNYTNPVSNMLQCTLLEFMESGAYERHIRRAKTLYQRKKEALINQLMANDSLHLCKIETYQIGLSFLLHIPLKTNIEKLLQKLHSNSILVKLLDEFEMNNNKHDPIVVLGFGEINEHDIPNVCHILLDNIQSSQES